MARGTEEPGAQKKHRLILDVTFSKPVTARSAKYGVQLVLDERLDLQKGPVWANGRNIYLEKVQPVELALALPKMVLAWLGRSSRSTLAWWQVQPVKKSSKRSSRSIRRARR